MVADPVNDWGFDLEAFYGEEVRREEQEMLEEAERDSAGVRKTCQSFAQFVKKAWHVIEPGTKLIWGWHLQAMCDHLQAISLGHLVSNRLIINIPPGSSKSTIVSVLWQCYEWGPLGLRHHRFVTTSFDLANVRRDNAKTLDVINSEWFQSLWNIEMKTEGVGSFGNYETGTRLGVAFKSITGKRGNRLIVDDPHSVDGAESEAQRDKATRNFIEGGLNRTNDWKTSAIVIVMQRLHEEDLTGVLLARDYGFIHLNIPMEFESARACETPLQIKNKSGEMVKWKDPRIAEGDLMDPERFPAEAIASIKLSGEYMYAGQYQQRPAPREGGMFKVDLIDVVEFCPPGGITVAGWDFAASTRKKSPYSVRVLMTRIGGDIYVRHVDRRHTNPTDLERFILECSIEDRNDVPNVLISFPQDPGSSGKTQKWRYAEILMGFNFKGSPETGSKEQRAEPFAAQVGAGRVHIVKGDWNSAFIEEFRNFPSAGMKDQVDAASRAFAEMIGAPTAPMLAAPEEMSENGDQYMGNAFEGDPWGA